MMTGFANGLEPMIRVKDLGKCYHIYSQPRHRLHQMLRSPFRVFNVQPRKYYREFWALHDVAFELKRGEILGVLGMNGSGKSTLLQLINGTLTPTNGTVEISGRTAALLELGAGFNPEFTGRENVFMNCSVMGLSETEIKERYDDIVAFADIGDFLEQPVKTYSSGMYIRLAFAAAINVDPDILIVDEALAVGDARFQHKCFNKLEELKNRGVTILFVTHSVDVVKSFCTKGMVLENGRMHYLGDPKEAAIKYYDILFPKDKKAAAKSGEPPSAIRDISAPNVRTENIQQAIDSYAYTVRPEENRKLRTFGKGGGYIDRIAITGLQRPNIFSGGEELTVEVAAVWDMETVLRLSEEHRVKPNILLGFALSDVKGTFLFGCHLQDKGIEIAASRSSAATAVIRLKLPHLATGTYFVTSAVALGSQENHIQLKWYDAAAELHCVSNHKHTYGMMHIAEFSAELH